MSNLQMQEEIFTPRDYQKPQLDFDDIWATIQTKIKIRIHKSIIDRVLDYCTYEDFSSDRDEYYIVDFPFVENDYHYDILLRIDGYIILLDTSEIKAHTAQLQKIGVNINQIAKRINETGRIYTDDMDELKRPIKSETVTSPADKEKKIRFNKDSNQFVGRSLQEE